MINPSIMKFKLIDKLLQTFGYAIINKNQNKAVNILSDHWNYFLGHIILYYIPLIVYFIILDYIPLIIEATNYIAEEVTFYFKSKNSLASSYDSVKIWIYADL